MAGMKMSDASPRKIMAMGRTPIEKANGGAVKAAAKPMKKGGKVGKGKGC